MVHIYDGMAENVGKIIMRGWIRPQTTSVDQTLNSIDFFSNEDSQLNSNSNENAVRKKYSTLKK